MVLKWFKISNYKSFYRTGDIKLTAGFNVIVGQNNAGKTALVEALSLRSGNVPHRSPMTLPTRSTPLTDVTKVEATFDITSGELGGLLRDFGSTIYVPSNENPAQVVE